MLQEKLKLVWASDMSSNRNAARGTRPLVGRARKAPANASHIMANCDSTHVIAAYAGLGPVKNFSDVLDQSAQLAPAKCLAAEQVIHMAESWRYLSSAMFALLNNESGNAIHLAYYCELRAALSLFCGSGLRIDRDNGFWIDSAGTMHRLGDHRTHSFAWKAWTEWVKRSDARGLLENSVRLLPSVTLKDFEPQLKQFDPTLMLSGWGLDLIRLKDDHETRNSVSYTAYWRSQPLIKMSAEKLEFIKSLSGMFLSSGSGLIFDRALVQYLVSSTLSSSIPASDPPTDQQIEARKEELNKIVSFVAKQTGADEVTMAEHLSANVGVSIFEKASDEADKVENVMARAAFMARLAMLFVKSHISLSRDENAKQWMRNWLESCGRWEPMGGAALEDLESDLNEAIDHFPAFSADMPASLWRGENLPHSTSLANLHACIAWGVAA